MDDGPGMIGAIVSRARFPRQPSGHQVQDAVGAFGPLSGVPQRHGRRYSPGPLRPSAFYTFRGIGTEIRKNA